MYGYSQLKRFHRYMVFAKPLRPNLHGRRDLGRVRQHRQKVTLPMKRQTQRRERLDRRSRWAIYQDLRTVFNEPLSSSDDEFILGFWKRIPPRPYSVTRSHESRNVRL